MPDDLDFLLTILRQGPPEAAALQILEKLHAAGRVRESLQEALEALHRHPESLALRLFTAERLLEAGFVTLAEREVEQIERSLRSLGRVFPLKADICRRRGRSREAQRAIEAYLALDPDASPIGSAVEQASGRPLPENEDLAAALRSLSLPPSEPQAENVPVGEEGDEETLASPTLAEIYLNQGDIETAVRIYTACVAADPGDSGLRRRLEELQTKLERQRRKEQRKRQHIAALEGWLERIRKKAHAESLT
ncbi:tetratricopeptide repeat protein [Desulfatiglans anilini]|uniref:tetratricopeptide repeat protein n=1 Tax=Desulfatiglans anilini TaxID=90728 RepID=UPI000423FAB9|nr:tetratricopeptide repeat protein [Desulfatiglans anilini]